MSVLAVTLLLASAVRVSGAQGAAAAPSTRPNPAAAPLVPGDRVLLKIWLDSSYVDTVRVDESSNVVLPRVGPTSLRGVPVSAIADSVRSAYRSILRTRAIEVTPLRRVGIVGDVRRPSVYYVDLTTSLRDAIALAGGVADIGDPNKVTVIRQGERTRVKDWENEGSSWAPLFSGDEILVGRQSFFERNTIAVVTAVSVLASIIFTLSRK